MSSPRTTSRRAATSSGAAVRQHDSHAALLRDASNRPAPSARSWRGRLDAIIVPASRPASALAELIDLAADLGTLLVVLCSGQTNVEQVRDRVGRVSRARALLVHLDGSFGLPMPFMATSDPDFARASAGRSSDLSVKRNFGLLLARAMGWRKIVFVDDDITLTRADVGRIAHQLENYEIAGMACRDFADNSVFCHARRLAKLPQDVFVTGAVLGVNCSDLPLPFFPDIYNEDWFFFGEAAARHRLTKAGEARQAPYDPFATPARAEFEEFGDLLAEGLYAKIQTMGSRPSFRSVTHQATAAYWSRFVAARLEDLADTHDRLARFLDRGTCSDAVKSAMNSLSAAQDQYRDDRITVERCVDYMEAYQQDVVTWQRTCSSISSRGSVPAAMDWLMPLHWETVR